MEVGPDVRLDFIGSYVQRSLKLKPEKWSRLIVTEEQRAIMNDFLDKPEIMVSYFSFIRLRTDFFNLRLTTNKYF